MDKSTLVSAVRALDFLLAGPNYPVTTEKAVVFWGTLLEALSKAEQQAVYNGFRRISEGD